MLATLLRRSLAPLAATLVSAACAGPQVGQLFGLTRVEKRALDACERPLRERLCRAREDGDACWEEVRATYERLPDTVDRKRFLVDSGCPSQDVEAWLPDVR